MDREHYDSGTEWESTVGYSRAIRTGDEIHVSGTTATDDDGRVVAPGDPYAQTARAIENVETALSGLGASLSDVVRTRLFVTDIGDWEAIGVPTATPSRTARNDVPREGDRRRRWCRSSG